MSDTRRPGPGLVQIKHYTDSWGLTFEGYTDANAVGAYLWPNGIPDGVQITVVSVVQGPVQTGEFKLTNLSIDAVQSMDPSIANWFEQELQGFDDPPEAPDVSCSAPSGQGDSSTLDVKMDENQLAEWVHSQLEATHVIGDVSEIVGQFAAEDTVLASVAEILGPAGTIASTIIVLWATIHAFGTGTRLEEQEGFCYGVMWETFGLPNGQKKFIPWAGDSADDLQQAFFDGVDQGREKAKDAKVHNAVMMKVAYYMASNTDLKKLPCEGQLSSAQQDVINELWKAKRETDLASDWLAWPNPSDMVPLPAATN